MSDFKTYWDLEEEGRAALTREEVERFLDAELMTKGVLKVAPLALDAEPDITEPVATTYYQVGPIAFTSAANADAFTKLAPVTIETKYLAGGYRSSVSVAAPLERDVSEKRLISASEFTAKRKDLESRAAIRDANEKRIEAHHKATKEQDKVLAGVYEDWHRCRDVDAAHRRVVTTFKEYVKTAGDELTAARFLCKVFTVEQIDEARKWLGADIPDVIADGEFAEAEPAAVKPEAPEELCF